MRRSVIGTRLTAVLLFHLASNPCLAEDRNLLRHGFEGDVRSDGLPAGWITYVPGGTAAFGVDPAVNYQGMRGLLIETASDIKATLVSDPIPVAPGEKLSLGVWRRSDSLTTSVAGALTFNAAFLDARRHYFRWHRAQPAAPDTAEWTRLTTEATVPPGAAYVTFQIGISRMTGRVWWAGPELRAEAPLAVRLDLATPRLEPGRQTVPAVVINRDPALAGRAITLVGQPGGLGVEHRLTLEMQQPVLVPFKLEKRGRSILKLAALHHSGEALAETSAEVTVPPLLVTEPLVPTHWCIEDGTPMLDGRLWVHEEEHARAKLALHCVLVRGKEIVAEWGADRLPPNPITFDLSAAGLAPGDYVLQYTLSTDGSPVATEAQDWHVIRRAEADVTLSPDGYPIVNGHRTFPIGMFNAGRFAEQAAAGFSVTHSYNAAATRPGQVPDNARLKRFLDETHAHGMKALVLLTHGSHARPIDDEAVRRARMFRNHPGLLAWDEEEGIARGEAPLTLVRDLRAMLLREDPYHPLMIGDTRDVIFKITDRSELFPADEMDLGMWWWYPFPLVAQRPSAVGAQAAAAEPQADLLEGEEASAGSELVPPSFLTQARTTKPIWVGLQAYKKPDRTDGRFPTPTEYRAQAYLAVIHGAKGLMYYVGSGSGGNGILNKPDEGHWEYLQELVTELRSMADVFMSADAPEQVRIEPPGAPISVRLKRVGDGLILLAANRSGSTLDVKLHVPGAREGPAAVRFENREAQVAQLSPHALETGATPAGHPAPCPALADRFAPYEVHVYEIPQDALVHP